MAEISEKTTMSLPVIGIALGAFSVLCTGFSFLYSNSVRDHDQITASSAIAPTVETRLKGVEEQCKAMDTRLDGIDVRLNRLEVRIDGIDKRIEGVDKRLDSQDGKLDKILDKMTK
jgi:septal ring factor EnvC (AmiA/AmiB activator)